MLIPCLAIVTPLPEVDDTAIIQAVGAVAGMVSPVSFAGAACEIGIRLDTDEVVQQLNRDFRQKDYPTNVLSFPADAATLEPNEAYLGDVILAVGVVQREAVALGIPVLEHTQHLVIHGILHLMGFDHMMTTDTDIMKSLEILILHQLGLSDPYA